MFTYLYRIRSCAKRSTKYYMTVVTFGFYISAVMKFNLSSLSQKGFSDAYYIGIFSESL